MLCCVLDAVTGVQVASAMIVEYRDVVRIMPCVTAFSPCLSFVSVNENSVTANENIFLRVWGILVLSFNYFKRCDDLKRKYHTEKNAILRLGYAHTPSRYHVQRCAYSWLCHALFLSSQASIFTWSTRDPPGQYLGFSADDRVSLSAWKEDGSGC